MGRGDSGSAGLFDIAVSKMLLEKRLHGIL